MSCRTFKVLSLLLLIATANPVSAQVRSRVDSSTDNIRPAGLLVTGSVSINQVRLTALALTQKIRLEVVSQTGVPLYDSGFRPGNRLEWELRDQRGLELRDGIYGCIVTVEDLDGHITHRRGILQVSDGAVSFDTLRREAAPSDEQENLTILSAEEPSPFTLVSHDGMEGWIESTSGGLSFYAGSLLRDRDAMPHLRLTPEGNVGIGVLEPQAKLDVAGLIRASEGFQFSDGTVLKIENGNPILVSSNGTGGSSTSAAWKTTRLLAAGGSIAALFAGGSLGRVLSNEIGTNTWFGEGAGNGSMTGNWNSFFGQYAGATTTSGAGNSAFGWGAGNLNSIGNDNSIFGAGAGYNNTASNNSFFGQNAGLQNTSGSNNSFFGKSAGEQNGASDNSAFGFSAGKSNAGGFCNSFFGSEAGYLSKNGYHNSFFGYRSGYSNDFGNWNAFFGYLAGYANRNGWNSFFGANAGEHNTDGHGNSFLGFWSGINHTTGHDNTFLGSDTGYASTVEEGNTLLGAEADFNPGSNPSTSPVTNSTAIGYRAYVAGSNSLVLGSINGVNSATADTNVGIGVTAPKHRLHVESSFPNPTGGGRATYSYTYFTPTSNNGGYIFGLESAARYTGQYSLTATHSAPGYALAALSGYYGGTVATGSGGTGSVGTVTGITAQNLMRSSITVNHAIGIEVQPAMADVGSATVGNVYGMYVKNPYNVSPTNVYGLYTENLTTGTNNYGVYVSGSSKSYFGGNVGIGITAPTEKLHVIGNMRVSGTIFYGTGQEPVPDYVFEPGYKLMPIDDLQRFVEREKHLPNIPNAAEIKEKGLNLSDFQMKLLKKIEELTLYTVEQAKTIREQQTAASRKEGEISALNARLAALEQMVDRLAKQK